MTCNEESVSVRLIRLDWCFTRVTAVVDEPISFSRRLEIPVGEKRDGHNRPCERRWDIGLAGKALLREDQEDPLFRVANRTYALTSSLRDMSQ